ncbi:16S rRNA (cytosine(967)-C(5))-methyltransferase RsmB [Fusibacter sp. JL298sf-3]
MKTIRETACDILLQIEQGKCFSHLALQVYFTEHPDVKDVDKRFLRKLVLGVLEHKLLLDFYIRKLSKQRFTRIEKRTVQILRVGLYQLTFLDRVPDSAVVNEAVNAAKQIRKSEGAFVNGILRAFIRAGKTLPLPNAKQHPATYLSIRYSHPEWLVAHFLKTHDADFVEALLKANNMTPPLSIRVNTARIGVDAYRKKLEEAGIAYSVNAYVPEVLSLEAMPEYNLRQLPGYAEGHFQVQDVASALIGHIATVSAGDEVVDVCAAPGGKATHIAQRLNGTGRVYARDISLAKTALIEENAQRLGFENIETEVFDATEYSASDAEKMALVLVDAPCSGLGIIRRKPDIKYNKAPEDLAALCALQTEILNQAAKYVKIEGELIYSTCTLNAEENEAVVKAFLATHTEFTAAPFDFGKEPVSGGMLTLYPHIHGTDGFFIAKLKRRE